MATKYTFCWPFSAGRSKWDFHAKNLISCKSILGLIRWLNMVISSCWPFGNVNKLESCSCSPVEAYQSSVTLEGNFIASPSSICRHGRDFHANFVHIPHRHRQLEIPKKTILNDRNYTKVIFLAQFNVQSSLKIKHQLHSSRISHVQSLWCVFVVAMNDNFIAFANDYRHIL